MMWINFFFRVVFSKQRGAALSSWLESSWSQGKSGMSFAIRDAQHGWVVCTRQGTDRDGNLLLLGPDGKVS
jgi:hypothetical protein